MDGRMGGWMDGWMDGWVDGWVGGWMDGWMDAYWCFEDLEGASDSESKEFPWFNTRNKGIRECKLECRYRMYCGIHV